MTQPKVKTDIRVTIEKFGKTGRITHINDVNVEHIQGVADTLITQTVLNEAGVEWPVTPSIDAVIAERLVKWMGASVEADVILSDIIDDLKYYGYME